MSVPDFPFHLKVITAPRNTMLPDHYSNGTMATVTEACTFTITEYPYTVAKAVDSPPSHT